MRPNDAQALASAEGEGGGGWGRPPGTAGGGKDGPSEPCASGWPATSLRQPPTGNRSPGATVRGAAASAADMKETWADITKAGRVLGWQPQVTPEDGFKRSVEWCVANKSWLKDISL